MFDGCIPFFILGAAKCGTTSLCHYLNQHPDIFFAEPKEPIYFEAEYEKGLGYYRKEYYEGWREEKAVGDARPANLFLPYVPHRIKDSFPDAKLIVILRNPVDRAYSHWWMRKTQNREELSFEEAIQRNRQRLATGCTLEGKDGEKMWRESLVPGTGMVELRTYLDMGYYADQVERYLDLFSKNNIKIILLRELSNNEKIVINTLFEFLDISKTHTVSDFEKRNVSFSPTVSKVVSGARKMQIGKLIPKRAKATVHRLLSKVGNKPSMPNHVREELGNHYRPHNRKLEKLTELDLSHWK